MNTNFLRHTAIYGLLIGIALVLLHVIDYLLGFYGQNKFFGLLQYAIIAFGIVWGALQYRNKESEGFITYGQVVGYGVITSVFFGVLTAVYVVFLYNVIDPGYVDKILEIAATQLYETGNFTDEQIDAALEMSRKFTGTGFTFFTEIFGSAFIGLIVSLIAGAFVRRNRPNTPFAE
jgi:hypothetical protein